MSSACSNPLLYGWLNENFKKEFRQLFSQCTSSSFVDCICRLKGSSSTSSTPSAVNRSLPGSVKTKPQKHEIIRDTSSSRELDTLNSNSNPAFNYCSNDVSKNNNNSSAVNSSTSILNSRPNITLYTGKGELIEAIESPREQTTELTTELTTEQTTEQTSGQTTGESKELITLERRESPELNQSNGRAESAGSLNDFSVNRSGGLKEPGPDDPSQVPNKKNASERSNSTTRGDQTKSRETPAASQSDANLRQYTRGQTHFNAKDLSRSESGDHSTLYLNFDQSDEFNEISKGPGYLSRTDAII